MKIAIYIPTASFFVGGGEVVPLMQAQYLKNLVDSVDLITLKTEKRTDIFNTFIKKNPEINIIYVDTPRNFEQFDRKEVTHKLGHEMYLALSRDLQDIFFKNKYDFVITHYAPAVFSIPANTYQVLLLHGVPKEAEQINQIAVNSADMLIAVSESVKEGWEKLFTINNEINVIHNGVDTRRFAPANIEQDIDILYVGRLIEIKGVQHLIKAIHLLSKKHKLNILIGGEGPYKEYLMSEVRNFGLEDAVKFGGYIPDDELLNVYQRSKVCIFPSYEKEGVLTTLLEASSCGKAVITSNCCGMIDLVKDNYNGLLFEPRNYKDLADKIEKVYLSSELRNFLGNNARNEVVKSWSWEKSASSLLDIINKNFYATN